MLLLCKEINILVMQINIKNAVCSVHIIINNQSCVFLTNKWAYVDVIGLCSKMECCLKFSDLVKHYKKICCVQK